jgi:pyruvate dehydrogenase E2 component (dihydrolipoamide acetyltransferase)
MSEQEIKVPDLGGADEVEIIEITVSEGDSVEEEDPILTVESDKASVELPSPAAGKILKITVKVGDKVSEGDVVGTMEAGASAEESEEDKPAEPEKEQKPEPEDKPKKAASGGGSRKETVKVPDLSGSEDVPIIEINVKEGDDIEEDDPLVTVESDKATMEIPSPYAGKVGKLLVSDGDKVSTGDDLLEMTVSGGEESAEEPAEEAPAPAPEKEAPKKKSGGGGTREETVTVPDMGGSEDVPIIEINVKEGDDIEEDDPLVTVESDKATMEIPSPYAGKVGKLLVADGDKVSTGDQLLKMTVSGGEDAAEEPESAAPPQKEPGKAQQSYGEGKAAPKPESEEAPEVPAPGSKVHAGPAVRKLAREFGADLTQVPGSGPKKRILKDDVQSYVKKRLSQTQESGVAAVGGGIPGIKLPDFSKFGKVDRESMSRMMVATANNMQRSWLNVPHVTQFDDADITEMEEFRKSQKAAGEKRGVKMTPMPFLLKACARALAELPQFNVALDMDKKEVIHKRYIHIGIAVDTPNGLMVPVIRDVDQKGLWELAQEAQELAGKARDKKLSAAEMQGACFSITSLGGIGGKAFTPIVNTPEVAILGVSKAAMQPIWDGAAFQPRLMLPLSLSYDHRAVNGADAARFTSVLCKLLGDIRQLLL